MKINYKDKAICRFSNFVTILESCFKSYFGIDDATLCAAYPSIVPDDNELKLPIITYKYAKIPAVLGSVAKNTELKPRHRETIKVYPDKNDEHGVIVDVYGQTFSYQVSFEVWGSNGEQADIYTEKFETFMNTYASYFKHCGISNLIFKSIDPSQEKNQWRSDLIKRELKYEMILDEITNFQQHDIKSIITEGMITEFNTEYSILDGDILKNN